MKVFELSCNNCGGTIKMIDNKRGICEYCRSKYMFKDEIKEEKNISKKSNIFLKIFFVQIIFFPLMEFMIIFFRLILVWISTQM